MTIQRHLFQNLHRNYSTHTKETLDRVVLKGLAFFSYHGVYPEENKLGQQFLVDATLSADLSKPGHTDDVNDTVNYAQVYSDIKSMFDQPPYHNLIETVAEKIAAKILHNHPKVEAVHVAIKKPHVAINPGPVDSLGIEIVRYRKGGAGAGGGKEIYIV